jgi:hypothetical protein
MWSSRSSSVEFVTHACIRSIMTGDNQSTPWFLGKFHFSQFMRSWSMEKRWWVQFEQALPSLKLMSSDQQMDLLSVEAHVLQSTYWSSLLWSSGALIIKWVVSQWDKYFCLDCSSMRMWERRQKLAQRWKLSRLGRLLEWDAFMPNLWPMHMTSRIVLPKEGDLDLLCRGLWWHCHAR